MSDSELTHNEDAKSNEDAALFVKQEKTKHPSSYTEKDDAKLLSDGTSEDGDEDDLVLEYSGLLKPSYFLAISMTMVQQTCFCLITKS